VSGPRALVLNAPRELAFEPIEDRALAPQEVRIRTLFSGISAGTELSQYRGTNPFMHRRWDEASRLFVEAEEPSWPYPVRNLGYEESGEIVEVNTALGDAPEAINTDPYGEGWMVRVRVSDPSEAEDLLDAAAYEQSLL